MSSVAQSLVCPLAEDPGNVWSSFTRGSVFLDGLAEDIRGGAVATAIGEIKEFETYYKVRYEQSKLAHALALCAMEAQKIVTRIPDIPGDPARTLGERLKALEFERISEALLGPCSGIPELQGITLQEWIWGSIQLLLGAKPVATVDVPIVYVSPSPTKGHVGTLHLELFESTVLGLLHDPRDALQLLPSARGEMGFHNSLRHALEAAAKGREKQPLGTYRVLDGWSSVRSARASLPTLIACGGASASGAARRGWESLMAGQIPDDGVVVLAAFTKDHCFEPVNEVTAKLEAIFEFNKQSMVTEPPPFDTVVIHASSLDAIKGFNTGAELSPTSPRLSEPEHLDGDLLAFRISP